jgi:dihydrofolate reductase
MIVSLIAAMSENRVIGRDGDLPWRLPRDMHRFKTLTTGHPVIMGRKTFETLTKPLPNRHNIVVTANRSYVAVGADVTHSLDAALALVEDDAEVFIAGGGEIYRLALPIADRIYLTVVHGTFEGNARFPEFSMEAWRLAEDIRYESDQRHAYPFSFRLYLRRTSEPEKR